MQANIELLGKLTIPIMIPLNGVLYEALINGPVAGKLTPLSCGTCVGYKWTVAIA